MKYKMIWLTLCICLLFVGCSNNVSLENTTQWKAPPQPTNTLSDGMNCILRTGFVSYDEYKEFVETSILPKGFCDYNALSHFGAFTDFSCDYSSRLGKYMSNNHYYGVVDSAGIPFTIGILPDENQPLEHSISATPDLSDMRQLGSNETGHYRYGNVFYKYINGEIYSIKWEIDGVQFYVRPTHSAMKDGYYPYVDTTVFGKLMNIQDKTPEEVFLLLQNG